MSSILRIAANELGTKELPGSDHNPIIVDYAKQTGFNWINDDETPWCSIFINWVALKAELERTNKANARSWLDIGTNVTSDPAPGDIVILWRESVSSWKGHVAIFLGYSSDKKQVFCLGGNQSNSVSVAAYPSRTILGIRRLEVHNLLQVPDKELRKGNKGADVKALQEALNAAGFSCGKPDGDYGSKTEAAVKALQATKSSLSIDGIFGPNTRDHLISLLSQ
ncbi:MAG: TIGR02594 family protein [Candidatus Cyclobacteriaceae bacterium M2_1C_046]